MYSPRMSSPSAGTDNATAAVFLIDQALLLGCERNRFVAEVEQMHEQTRAHAKPNSFRTGQDERPGIPVDVERFVEAHVGAQQLPVVAPRFRLETNVDRKP